MISYFLICDLNQQTLLDRFFRTDFNIELKFEFFKQYKIQNKPCLNVQGFNFICKEYQNLMIIIATRFNVSLSLFQDYLQDIFHKIIFLFGEFNKKILINNIQKIQELVEYIFDFGYYSYIEFDELISIIPVKQKLKDTEIFHKQYVYITQQFSQVCFGHVTGYIQFINRNKNIQETVIQFEKEFNLESFSLDKITNDIDLKFNKKLRINSYIGVKKILQYQMYANYTLPIYLKQDIEFIDSFTFQLSIKLQNSNCLNIYLQQLKFNYNSKDIKIYMQNNHVFDLTKNSISYSIKQKDYKNDKFKKIDLIFQGTKTILSTQDILNQI